MDLDLFDRSIVTQLERTPSFETNDHENDNVTIISDITCTTKDLTDLSDPETPSTSSLHIQSTHDPLLPHHDSNFLHPHKEILLNSNITLPKGLMTYSVNKELTGLEAIRALPHHISGTVNSGNLKELRELIYTHFDENCTYRSQVIEDYLTGRDYVFMLFEALLQAIPDYIFVTKKTTFVKNKAVNQVYFLVHVHFKLKINFYFNE